MRLTGFPRIVATAVLAGLGPGLAHGAEVPPRLAGIVIGPRERVAIFADRADGRQTVLGEGEALGRYTVKSITARNVVVVGPDGAATLNLEHGQDQPGLPMPDVEADVAGRRTPDPAPMQAETTSAGAAIGRLALARDACARGGFLPGIPADAEAQLTAVIAGMAAVPPRGADAADGSPAGLLASALRAGLDVARREGRGQQPGASPCAGVNALWSQSAGRYGLR